MLNNLSPQPGSKKNKKRVGRGTGSTGKTSGKGHKGQRARSGGRVSAWFEGGQTPLKMRSPKRGFTSRKNDKFDVINVSDLNRFGEGEVVTREELVGAGLVRGKNPVKVLGNGELERSLTVKADAFSKSAIAKIEEKGGKADTI
ncbi:MAG: 50S ribosomal protein L15 [Candidatus Dadabacteria bacterium]|jgi:large subunit ribosomal protein L15|nr:MAG: 50S ribosomal protein L15 [Candidatus Dadabacteria bacterium]